MKELNLDDLSPEELESHISDLFSAITTCNLLIQDVQEMITEAEMKMNEVRFEQKKKTK